MKRLSICVLLATITAGCELRPLQDSPAALPAAQPTARKPQVETALTPVKLTRTMPAVPLIAGSPTALVLSELHKAGSRLMPQVAGCTKLPVEVASFVSSVASQAKLLQVRIGAGATTHSLAILAGTLRNGVDAVTKRTPEQAELQRLQLELTASVKDIAETLAMLARKLGSQDLLAVEHARARLRNAAGNYVTTVRTLVRECAPGL